MKNKEDLLKEFIIPFVGLKIGKHTFEFHINESFFDAFEYNNIEKGELDIIFEFEKRENLFTLHFTISGEIEDLCDKCGGLLKVEIFSQNRLFVKFGDELAEESEEMIVIPENSYELDISSFIYEFAVLSVPLKKIHEDEADCNQETLKKLEDYFGTDEEDSDNESDIDPRWAALKNLNNG